MIKKLNKKHIILLISVVVIAAAAIVFFVLTGRETILQGVSINGIDVSGMTREEALKATESIPGGLLKKIAFSINFNGEVKKYSPSELGVDTDYNDIVDQAVAYGHSGTAEERQQAIDTAKEKGKAFTVAVRASKDKVLEALQPIKEALDKAAEETGVEFMPWGYLSDGQAYSPDKQEVIESCANGKKPALPSDLVRIAADEMPNELRYEFWKNSYYVDDYIPADANIARFRYTGLAFDMDVLADSIVSAVQNDDYGVITAKGVVPDDLKNSTRLIASWTSSFSNHSSWSRVWNVTKLSGIINGVVIQPGETWSINAEAGPRTVSGGWKEAAGLLDGGTTMQAGGGVCQISSTTYNAAIRAGLVIAESKHHSISSDYIPLGLDATISSGGPDLKIKNPYDSPVYIVSYVNPVDKNVTVEIYGPPVTDSEHGEVILHFSSKNLGSFGSPKMEYIYNATKAPDGRAIAEGKSYVYARARQGKKAQTYKHTLSPDGKELKVEEFTFYNLPPLNGKTYVNDVDPEKATPTPTISATAKPTATPKTTPKPTATPAATAEPSGTPEAAP